MQGKKLSNICSTVMNFFTKTAIDVDEAVKFVKRKSKLGAKLFAEALITGCLADPTVSLERLCRQIREKGVKITKQGLHQRFNAEATALMSNLYTNSLEQFKNEKQPILDLLKAFSTIKIHDSSGVSLPSVLKNTFKGYGGSGSGAGLKLQLSFDYVRGQIDDVIITEEARNDQSFDDHLVNIEKDALYLQDLGYFKIESFLAIQAKNAYFISRYLHPTKITDIETNEPLDLLLELQKAGTHVSKEIWLGRQKEKLKVRLIAFRLSDIEVEKRIHKLKRNAQKHGRIPKKEALEFAKWSIYVTNVDEGVLNDEQVYLIYSLRWQIELFFKLCKSEAGIDKISGRKHDRILCEIYAKLICIVMLLYFCFPIRWQANQELSFYKAYKLLKLRASDFHRALKTPYLMVKFLKNFLGELKNYAYKDDFCKRKRLSYQKIMDAAGQEVLI